MTRGIRNKNPGNIVKNGIEWNGLYEWQTDDRFCVFEHATYGIRAMCMILLTYYNKHKLKTVDSIIKRYSSTDQEHYINYVCGETEFLRNEVVPMTPHNMRKLLIAMIKFENGNEMPYTYELEDAIKLSGMRRSR
jgi:hypothetical protein